jgi:hypothetical protein
VSLSWHLSALHYVGIVCDSGDRIDRGLEEAVWDIYYIGLFIKLKVIVLAQTGISPVLPPILIQIGLHDYEVAM